VKNLNCFNNYLCQVGYVFTLYVCGLLVCSITQKLLDRFAQNSVEMWYTGQGRNKLCVNMGHVMLELGYGWVGSTRYSTGASNTPLHQ